MLTVKHILYLYSPSHLLSVDESSCSPRNCNKALQVQQGREKRMTLCHTRKDLLAPHKESVTGYSGCWVQLCPLKAPNICSECGPQIKGAPLLPVPGWVQNLLGCSWWKKMAFSLSFTKAIRLPQSVSSEASQMLLLCINHRQKAWGWLEELCAAEAGKEKELVQTTGRFFATQLGCSRAAIFSVLTI